VVNKTREEKHVVVKLLNHKGRVTMIGGEILVKPEKRTQSVLFVKVANSDLESEKISMKLGVYLDGVEIDQVETKFISPKK
jgi:hypothetical protein